MDVVLRDADAGDREFLWTVQWVTLGQYVTEVFGTTHAEQRAFFDEHHRLEGTRVVMVDGRNAGVFAWRPETGRGPGDTRDDHWYLANVGLLPQFRAAGIGSALLTGLLADADAARVPVRLQVLRSNPRAHAMYRRLGFVGAGRTASHIRMVRHPRPTFVCERIYDDDAEVTAGHSVSTVNHEPRSAQ